MKKCLIELIILILCKYLIFTNKLNSQKNNGHVSPVVYRIERSWTKGHANEFLHNIKRGLEAIAVAYGASPGTEGKPVSLTNPVITR